MYVCVDNVYVYFKVLDADDCSSKIAELLGGIPQEAARLVFLFLVVSYAMMTCVFILLFVCVCVCSLYLTRLLIPKIIVVLHMMDQLIAQLSRFCFAKHRFYMCLHVCIYCM